MNSFNDIVASGGVRWGRGSRGLVHGEQIVSSVEGVAADRHGVQVLTKQEPQLLVFTAQIGLLFLQSFPLQHGSVDAPRHLLQLGYLLQMDTKVSVLHSLGNKFTVQLVCHFQMEEKSNLCFIINLEYEAVAAKS